MSSELQSVSRTANELILFTPPSSHELHFHRSTNTTEDASISVIILCFYLIHRQDFDDAIAIDITKSLQRVGKYLIQHKFFERDQRVTHYELVHMEPYFMTSFPKIPLRRVPAAVQNECRRGFVPCLKRIDFLINKKFPRKQLFQIRTAASYYMCWYTMMSEPLLERFYKTCHIPYNWTELAEDYRGYDKRLFDCALHSFCPDPCCGHLNRTSSRNRIFRPTMLRPYVRGTAQFAKDCTELPDFPCGFAAGGCKLDPKKNRSFLDLINNRFNTTCSCLYYKSGYVFDEVFRLCVVVIFAKWLWKLIWNSIPKGRRLQ
ncbi:hypothetical protein HELRODRAFT_176610 [Helobdella robusta]|uniref:Uncharacterized protein n=1 Tax=Helobdella robusta TaxID=6412 RepID=T1FAQ4_HELRO|nr:hypothetical protein HELRODRAFT_176610 [Helobdella robusta]ESN99845.1 hypothetical protein HELRODRAFT_176610 [Helobdella robusta]